MTIKDLSRETGYSVGTISRVLNGQPNVSEKARKTILAYIEKIGFQPNINAKYLKQQYGDSILTVVTGRSNELFAHMIEHIQRALSATRYSLIVDYVDENGDAVQRAAQLVLEKKPLGILFLGGDARLFEKSFTSIRLPSVLLTADPSALNFPNLSSVTTDDLAAARCAVAYLFEAGHRNIGIISGDLGRYGPSRMRYDGCRLAFADYGLPFDENRCIQAKYSFEDGYTAAQKLIDQGGITAIFAMSDVMAIGAIRALKDRGLRVPEDFSVFGYDGIEMGEYYIPKLTTIRQQADLLAQRGVSLLLESIENQAPVRHEKVPFELSVNDSVTRKE